MRIVIDPGHGPGNRRPGVYDPGASGNGIEEAAYVMSFSDELANALLVAGHAVTLTRKSGDRSDAPLSARHLAGRNKDLFLSIHCNSWETDKPTGVEVLVKKMGIIAFQGGLSLNVAQAFGVPNRGPKAVGDALAILRNALCPAALLELPFVSNPSDAAALLDKEKRAKAIAVIVATLSRKL